MNSLDLLLIGFIMLLLWGSEKGRDWARQIGELIRFRHGYDRAPEDKFSAFALMLLMVAAFLWTGILKQNL